MKTTPGSLIWLLSHDLVLSWRRLRDLFGKASNLTMALIVLSALVAFHALAAPASAFLLALAARFGPLPVIAAGFFIVLPWMLSQALTSATRALYSRGDLDLLIASPLSQRAILTSRGLAIAIECFAAVGLFLLPIANANAWLGGVRWLAIYPALASAALFSTALGLFLTMGLFRWLGPRRTRAAGQALATVVGAWFVICAQVYNFMAPATRAGVLRMIAHPTRGGLFDPDGWLWTPVRAGAGDIKALAIWTALSAGLFALAIVALGRAFAQGAIGAAGVGAATRTTTTRAHLFRPGSGAALRRKEWRLLRRDPYLISQIVLQSLYTAPVALIIWKSLGPNGSLAISTAPALVAMAAQISASLAWLAVSSEDAPEFLKTAPISAGEIERRKFEAVAAPLALFLAAPMLVIAFVDPRVGLWTLLFASAAALSTALLNFWRPCANKRGDLMRRHAQSKLVGLMEHLLALFWALAAMLACFGSAVALAPALCALLVLALNRPKLEALA